MRDRNGLTIRAGDTVDVQTGPEYPTIAAKVIAADGARVEDLAAVLVEFDNGTRQYMGGEHLAVRGPQ